MKKEKDWFTDFARKAELVVTDSESEDDIDTWERVSILLFKLILRF